MSTMSVPVRRHALGLPAGSVRAAHVLGLVAIICALVLIPARDARVVAIPPYLFWLLFLMLGHYFAWHGMTVAMADDFRASPLYLPGGVVRFLIVAALLGTFGWKYYSDSEGLYKQFEASMDAIKAQPELPVIILGGFFLGVIVRTLVGRKDPPAAWQDLEAWISLIALIGILLAGGINLLNLQLKNQLFIDFWEGTVGGVIAFYFGERS